MCTLLYARPFTLRTAVNRVVGSGSVGCRSTTTAAAVAPAATGAAGAASLAAPAGVSTAGAAASRATRTA